MEQYIINFIKILKRELDNAFSLEVDKETDIELSAVLSKEIEILEKYLKLYREQKNDFFKIPGSFIRVEDTMEYLQGFRDGVVRSAK